MQTKAAKRYAAALHSYARQHGLTTEILKQLEEIAGLWQDSPELRQVMQSPRIERSRKAKILQAVGSRLEFSQPLTNLFNLLLDKGRLAIFPALFREFEALEDMAAGRTRARCLVAHSLTEQQLGQLRRRLIKISGAKDVLIALEADPSLLAGFVVSIDGKIIDGSLKGRLNRLQRSLAR
ncbi:MAG: ATP synthase F1 subunit delta [Eubacteriales bacterium]|nr:ATP synthase F1 subunit delta [Eubacteriales bacterium]MDD3072932.1 ATP synthase F1 subunit delta [Eubacteriales bacterium]MDD4078153.1 ATP synthase F1 subunit delta [Eubacteriales bacterium]MDD4768440.1 ATP synthase F1 subunit delta [Eubacteriales bacterium]